MTSDTERNERNGRNGWDEQRALAAFCAVLPRLRAMLRGPASRARRAAVEQVVLTARRGEPVGELLAGLGIDSADPVPAAASRATLPTPVEEDRPARVTGVYLCPLGRCPRAEERTAASELPSCGVHDQALRFVADR
ncbi:hypothetical protein [Streptomyces cucumeris]|uniref:hypothetical protein n=1 Tax=Streptomyces cucumeris TaxID=2962890 RepID=UPI0020C87299|nr:hypothetical protein [Streptomyces sp. NEAU-Y11]MCP9208849.1 hypothetical protein [Streptomyces sp. NEAU-Y11]